MRAWLWLLAVPLFAHMVSLSSGQMDINGTEAQLVLRVPAYELAAGEQSLDNAYQIQGATMASRACVPDGQELVCTYKFTAVPASPRIICRLAQALVANHVHVLTARRNGEIARQVFSGAVFDADLRFGGGQDPIPAALDGVTQAFSGWARLLLLFTIGFAARRRREALAFALALAVSQAASLFLALPASPRFVEAAAAIGVGYLAFEVLMLPQAGHRWLAVAGVGLLLGLGVPSGGSFIFYSAFVLSAVATVTAIGLWSLARRPAARPVSAALLLLAILWFSLQVLGKVPSSF